MSDVRAVTAREAFERLVESLDAPARIPVEIRTEVADPYDAYLRAREGRRPDEDGCGEDGREAEGGVYLETTGGQDGWGYFATDPERWLTTDGSARTLDAFPTESRDAFPTESRNAFPALEALLDEERLVRGDCDVPYPCGAFGWLSYDVARELEDLPDTTEDDRGLPRMQFGVYDRVAAWREPRGDGPTGLRITCCPRVAPADDTDNPAVIYERAVERARELARRVREGDPAPHVPPAPGATATFRNEVGREEYAERVRRVKEYVRDGETFQTNVSQRLVAPASVHPVSAFAALRRVNPAPYSALIEFPGVDLVSSSPELLLDCEGDRLVTEPIAGTRPRGDTAEADRELERELLDSEKEHAEHAMLVDLERNDLGKVAEYGSVEVTDYRRVDRYSEVLHTVSKVEGRRRADASVADAIAAVFPGGTITGAPKPRTMEIIDELESTRRGPYTGAIGVVGFDERATLNMTIRTLVRSDDSYYLRVGAGIVHDSGPYAEYEETLDKARALIRAMDEALGDDNELAVEE